MASASPVPATIFVLMSPSSGSSSRCGCNARAGAAGRSLVMSGHSAGGHLAACMLRDRLAGVRSCVARGSRHGGLHHFGPVRSWPLVETSLKQRLCVSTMQRRRLRARYSGSRRRAEVSMRWWRKRKRGIFPAKHGHCRCLGCGGLPTRFAVVPAANHFTAIAPLADPEASMVRRLAQLAAG